MLECFIKIENEYIGTVGASCFCGGFLIGKNINVAEDIFTKFGSSCIVISEKNEM